LKGDIAIVKFRKNVDGGGVEWSILEFKDAYGFPVVMKTAGGGQWFDISVARPEVTLTRDQMRELLPYFQAFEKTGSLEVKGGSDVKDA
jgi:hypothetical protein